MILINLLEASGDQYPSLPPNQGYTCVVAYTTMFYVIIQTTTLKILFLSGMSWDSLKIKLSLMRIL